MLPVSSRNVATLALVLCCGVLSGFRLGGADPRENGYALGCNTMRPHHNLSDIGLFLYITERKEPMRLEFWRYWLFDDPKWDWRKFDYDRDVAYADARLAAVNRTTQT